MLPTPGFHHLHLNSVDPDAAIAWYTRQFASTAKAEWGGHKALRCDNNVLILFDKVDTPAPQQPKLKINTLKTTKTNSTTTEQANQYTRGNTEGIPQGKGTGPPVSAPPATPAPATPPPTPTPKACARPNIPPSTLRAVEPDMPAMAQQQGITGDVTVDVSLDEASHIVGATVESSPSKILNNAALSAARQSTFQTEIKDCKPIAATYRFVVTFASQ